MSSDLAKLIVVAALEENAVTMKEHVDVALSARVKTFVDDYKTEFAGDALEERAEDIDIESMSEEEFADYILSMDENAFSEFCDDAELEDDDINALEEMRIGEGAEEDEVEEMAAVDDMYSGVAVPDRKKTKGKKGKAAQVNKESNDDDDDNDDDEKKK